MIITWLGHSCFKVEVGKQSLIFDPFKDGSVEGYRNIRESANYCLCSHLHGDHCGTENVQLVPMDREIFEIERLDSFHDDQSGRLRGNNIIHLVTVEGYRLAHLGDLGCMLTEDQIEKLQDLDVLFIPVGGYFTIGPKQAEAIVKQLNPKIIIPMHYRGDGYGYDVLQKVTEFTKYFDKVTWLTTNVLSLSDELDGEVVVFDYPQE